MPDIINSVKEEFINEYIRKIDTAIETYNATIGSNDEIFDLVIEISNVFENDIPNLQTSVLIRTGTEIRDANIVRAMLIKELNIKVKESKKMLRRKDFGIHLFIGSKQNYLAWNC